MVADKPRATKKKKTSRTFAYQYETSPKKLDPQYEYAKKPKTQKETYDANGQKKTQSKYNYKPVLYLIVGFIMLFTISYRNSQINEIYNKKENLKVQLAEIKKENEQLKVNIESSLNLSSIEKIASEQLGMQKLTNDKKIFVNLQKKDYVEPATEEIIVDKNTSVLEKILNALTEVIQ